MYEDIFDIGHYVAKETPEVLAACCSTLWTGRAGYRVERTGLRE